MARSVKTRDLVSASYEWLGTPFYANLRNKGIGCDCAGLIEGILAEFQIPFPERGAFSLQKGLMYFADEVDKNNASVGDILLFNNFGEANQFHCALLVDGGKIIHAHWSQGVVLNTYGNWFFARTIGVYRIKGVNYG